MCLSPLHARVLWLFACVKDRRHICGLDNLYNSAKFCRVAYVHSKVLLNGVTRKGKHVLPKCVLQEEKKKRSDVLAARGTVKAAVLKNDPLLTDLMASSVYDTKPVHFLSTFCESIKWIVKERQTFNVNTGKTEDMCFLRFNQNDFYNFSMGSVDVSDQLRNSNRFDHWLRNRKWWWSLLFWWLGVMLVNAYIYSITLNLVAGENKKELLSHIFPIMILETTLLTRGSVQQRTEEATDLSIVRGWVNSRKGKEEKKVITESELPPNLVMKLLELLEQLWRLLKKQ
jgi:hypothetical protein